MLMRSLLDLPQAFREIAAFVRQNAAAEEAATAWERAADRLEVELRELFGGTVTLDEAEVESGYSRKHLLRLIREGTIPNVGTEASPMITRVHLPRKPGYAGHALAGEVPEVSPSRAQVARAVVAGG